MVENPVGHLGDAGGQGNHTAGERRRKNRKKEGKTGHPGPLFYLCPRLIIAIWVVQS